MKGLTLFVLMLAAVVASACGPVPVRQPEIGLDITDAPHSAVVSEASVSISGTSLSYVTVVWTDNPADVRKLLVDNTKKFAVGDTVKAVMVHYQFSGYSSSQYIWTIAK